MSNDTIDPTPAIADDHGAGDEAPGAAGDEAPGAAGARPPRDPRPVVNVPAGRARLIGEAAVRPDGRPDEELVLQGLEGPEGDALLRVGYRREGRMLRGPVTVTPAELGALVDALRGDERLAPALRSVGGGG